MSDYVGRPLGCIAAGAASVAWPIAGYPADGRLTPGDAVREWVLGIVFTKTRVVFLRIIHGARQRRRNDGHETPFCGGYSLR